MLKNIKAFIFIFVAFLFSGCTFFYQVFGPSIPQDLQINNTSSFSTQIRWESDPDFSYYITYASADNSHVVSSMNVGSVGTYVIEDLLPNTEYSVSLESSYGDKKSKSSDALSFKTLLGPPSFVSITLLSESSLFLSWDAVPQVDGYTIYYGTDSSFTGSKTVLDTKDAFYTISGLTPSTEYYFAVAAYDDLGEGDPSPVNHCITVVSNYALGFYEVASSDTVLNLTGLEGNRVFMLKMNPFRDLIGAENTRSILTLPSSKNITNESRTVVRDPFLEKVLSASEAGFLVSGVWDSGAIRYDKLEPQVFLENLPELSDDYSRSLAKISDTPQKNYVLNDTKNFWVEDNNGDWVEKSSKLVSIGNSCYVWVAEENFGDSAFYNDNKITQEQINAIATNFDILYLPETTVFGSKYSLQVNGFIAPKDKISIFVYDIDEDYSSSQNSGVFGYFWSKDFYPGDTDGNISGYTLKTNEDELFYVDSHFLDAYPNEIYSTLAHEFQHMLHFVNKSLQNNLNSSTWYNEMLSLVSEDLLATYIGIDKDNGPQSRMYDFVSSYYKSGLVDWLSGNDVLLSYAGAYAFGAFISRNYGGAEFIKNIASSVSVDQKSISDALSASGYSSDNFASVFKSYGRSLCYPNIPESKNIPSLNKKSSVTLGSYTYTLLPINLLDYYFYFNSVKRYGLLNLDSSSSGSVDLRPYGFSVHYWGRGTGDISLAFTTSRSDNEKVYIIVE